MKRMFLLAAAFSVAIAIHAQDFKSRLEKSPRHGEFVKIKHDSREVESFISYPSTKDKATAVVVIHEIFGLSDWVRLVTDELAEAGYIAIAPDLLWGKGPNGGGTSELGGDDGARRVIGSLPADQITADLNAAVDYVSKQPSCNGKVVVIGFCWGGGQTFRFATNNKNIKAAFPYYGAGPTDETAIARIACPVYGSYAGEDNRVSATVPKSTELMKAAGKTYEPVIYDGAHHGFMRAGDNASGDPNDKKARDEAWKRMKDILGKI